MTSSDAIAIPETMFAGRLHAVGEPMRLDRIPVPGPRPTDVLVEVKACGMVPNLRRVVANYFGTLAADPKLFPPLPAIFGLDPAGVVVRVGEQVTAVRPGERVYVNPARGCGSCRMCRHGKIIDCPDFTFQGYFGRSKAIMQAYPYGGLAQYITAPASALVKLPDSVSFECAARLGYLGTAYSAMKKIGVGPGEMLLVNGASGTLGVCAIMMALAMGASRILATARNAALLERVRQLAPARIHVHSVANDTAADGGALLAWTREMTGGAGVDRVIDCLPPGAPASAMAHAIRALRRGGKAVNVGAMAEELPLNAFWLMANQISLEGSVWFTTAEGEEMCAMADSGQLDLAAFLHDVWPLSRVNEALAAMGDNQDGGFANFVIDPTRAD